MEPDANDLIHQAWVLTFRLAWAATVAPGQQNDRLMRCHGRALRRWLRRVQQTKKVRDAGKSFAFDTDSFSIVLM